MLENQLFECLKLKLVLRDRLAKSSLLGTEVLFELIELVSCLTKLFEHQGALVESLLPPLSLLIDVLAEACDRIGQLGGLLLEEPVVSQEVLYPSTEMNFAAQDLAVIEFGALHLLLQSRHLLLDKLDLVFSRLAVEGLISDDHHDHIGLLLEVARVPLACGDELSILIWVQIDYETPVLHKLVHLLLQVGSDVIHELLRRHFHGVTVSLLGHLVLVDLLRLWLELELPTGLSELVLAKLATVATSKLVVTGELVALWLTKRVVRASKLARA